MKRIVLAFLLALALPALAQQHGSWTVESHPKTKIAQLNNPTESLGLGLLTENNRREDKKIDLTVEFVCLNDGEEFRWEAPLVNPAGKTMAQAGIELTLTFDSDAPIVERWQGRGDTALKSYHPSQKMTATEFLDKLRKAKKLTVGYTLKTGKREVTTFDLTGTNDLMAELCGGEGCNLQ